MSFKTIIKSCKISIHHETYTKKWNYSPYSGVLWNNVKGLGTHKLLDCWLYYCLSQKFYAMFSIFKNY